MKSYDMRPLQGIILLFFLSLTAASSFAQQSDTIRKSIPVKDSVLPFDYNKIVKDNVISRYSDTTGYDAFIWNDKRTLGEILNEKAGFLINNFGGSSRTAINYFGGDRVGLYRDGIPLNNIFIDGFDAENISVNEIEKLEEISPSLSFLYGPYSSNGAVNIVTKDKFVPNMFSQLRYTQDRDGALYADFNINFPVSRKFGIQLGLGNHGSDGHYANSDFALWRGRIRLNYYPTDRINIKFNYYQNKLQRGLNGGLVNSTKDTLVDPKLADVNNTDAYEKWSNYYSDVQTTLRLLNDRNSLTRIQLYSQNLTRAYRDEENRTASNGVFVSDDYHFINYGVSINQNLFVKFTKDIVSDLNAGYVYSYNSSNFDRYYHVPNTAEKIVTSGSYNMNQSSVYSRLDVSIADLKLSGGVKADFYPSDRFFGFGGQGEYLFRLSDDASLKLIAGGSLYKYKSFYLGEYYYENEFNSGINEMGFALAYDGLRFKLMFRNIINDENVSFKNAYADFSYTTKYFDVLANLTTLGGDAVDLKGFPELYFKSDISYHDFLFKNKLNLRTGFNIKYMSSLSALYYYPRYNVIGYQYPGSGSYKGSNFNVDFYVGARIGKANINLTFANLFNTLFYDSYLYPWDERGGFLKSLSRFTITWDFWN